MKGYLYDPSTGTTVLTLENVIRYTDSSVTCQDGSVYGPFAEGLELSFREDLSETRLADWKRDHPDHETRINELEALMAELLFGGDPQ